MELVSDFRLNPYRIYKSSRRANKGIATFTAKPVNEYMDYSVDFSRLLETNEQIIHGSISVYGAGLVIGGVYPYGSYLTAFIDGGRASSSYYMTFTARTNTGGVFTQEMIMPVIGTSATKRIDYKYASFTQQQKPPNTRPPLNGLKINDRYLLNDSGFFMVI
ncbi:phage fiber-tail adaptor protein [Commensalibacter oyaizuii]|uniref:Uncharacterized protein n=1 Tax=Commensalibacter oyaizuii TaxID=3043873 RepID=A0ABT6Q2X8_9PROT|nr:hypothetical protein [Commensalibacter sp. TBRC 16381]MDI2091463.1 hypothetical protein [Commensalibacter sp. TBRC 16381]